ncbi:MAG: galactose/methyl galactoside ABC transporter permease MglC [Sphaerochaeta sp.]|jgi:methyl-galactoside transport system permease protein|uniref:galactose/methyl galactoside ABC transporter permease MglC n=1 Tax=Sphaerochaeta sp. TaxID=1972642 RepID=UPI002FCCA502
MNMQSVGNALLGKKNIKQFVMDKAIFMVLLLLVIIIAIINPRILRLQVLRDILMMSSTKIIMALGMMFVILTGGVDLGGGRMVGMAAVISASMLQTADYVRRFYPGLGQIPIILPILLALLIGTLFGMMNGLIVAKFKVPAFIATLSSMLIIYGVNSIYFNLPPNNSQPIGGLRADFTYLGSGSISFIPVIVIFAAIVSVIVWFVLNKTVFGKNVYAVGGNPEAAAVSGINITQTLVGLFGLCGFLIALSGVLEAARTGGATNNYGNGYELDAIASCVVGGVSTTGGVGTVSGVIAGVIIFSFINYGLTFIGVNPYWQNIIKGAIIVAAVSFDIRKYVQKK